MFQETKGLNEYYDRYSQATAFIQETITKNKLGYVYAFPDKRLYRPLSDSTEFINQTWKGFEGDLGIYIHTPYCTPKSIPEETKREMKKQGIIFDGRSGLCGYCNLYAEPRKQVPGDFSELVTNEVALYKNIFAGKTVRPASLYFGGGTPSMMDAASVRKIINGIEGIFGPLPDDIEKTIECNPDSVDAEKFKAYKLAGLNRVSIGVQTFNRKVLEYLGRDYDPALGGKAISDAKNAGLLVNGDLIAGLPLSDQVSFLEDVTTMINLTPETITIYQNALKPLTRFGQMANAGMITPRSNSEIIVWTSQADALLRNAGYKRQSLTCWTKENRGYKQGDDIYKGIPVIGFGPGARSYGPNGHYALDFSVDTRGVHRGIASWEDSIQKGRFPEMVGIGLTSDIRKRRIVILGLMSSNGLAREMIDSSFSPEIQALLDNGMITDEAGILKYTDIGMTFSGVLCQIFYGKDITDTLSTHIEK